MRMHQAPLRIATLPLAGLAHALCWVWLLAGCATAPSAPPSAVAPAEWAAQQAYAGAAMPFEVLGKVGMPRGSANVRWRQHGDAFELRFWGPFGAGVATLEGNTRWVRFVRDDVRREGDPVAILADELGWRVPVGALAWWVRGLPAPDRPVNGASYVAGRLAQWQQDGWAIAIERYGQQADGGWLPEKVTALGANGRFTLVVQQWRSGAAVGAESLAPAP